MQSDFHWLYSHIFVVTLLILSSYQPGSFLVNSIHNTDNFIIQSQNNKAFSNNSKTDAIPKRIAEVKQPEQKPLVNHLGISVGCLIFKVFIITHQK